MFNPILKSSLRGHREQIIRKRVKSFAFEAQSVRGWEKVVLYRKLMKLHRPSLDGIFTHYTITGVGENQVTVFRVTLNRSGILKVDSL